MQNKIDHIPVMLNEVLNYLKPNPGNIILDGTFGAGNYSKSILNYCDSCKVIAIDRDSYVSKFAGELSKEYGNRFVFHNIKFSEVLDIIEPESLDGIVLDLGVSSMQLDESERGFSFNKEAKLSMVMGRNDINAYDIVNDYDEENIASIIDLYGEENKSKLIAKRIVGYRKHKKIETTTELASIVHSCFNRRSKIDNATKTFQALRIFVNDELNELKSILDFSIKLLKKDGRLIVVSFHSLEDRIVKNFFNENGDTKKSKLNKYKNSEFESIFKVITKKPISVSIEEAKLNKRSRSAKLRCGVKC